VPAALIALCAIPLVMGSLRLVTLAGGPEIMPYNARFTPSPLPVVLHIVNAAVLAILGAFQFVPGFRRRRPGWHRRAGRILVACGLLVGLSGLWMTLFYSRQPGTGDLLYAFRLLFGSAMVVSIVLGFAAIRRGDVRQHRAWLMRGYAIGLGAGTQALPLMVGGLIAGPPSELSNGLLNGAGWVINLAVAEWIIRHPASPPALTANRARVTGFDQEPGAFVPSAAGAPQEDGRCPSATPRADASRARQSDGPSGSPSLRGAEGGAVCDVGGRGRAS
jgi:uncharacterized membrane protein YozB (DUF420 family)